MQDINPILIGCIKNDRKSQKMLYQSYYAYAMSVSVRYVGQEDEAISIVNDAFMKVFDNLKKFDRNKDFKPWLRKILVNTALNHMKKQSKFKMEKELNDEVTVFSKENIFSKIAYSELIKMVQNLSTAYRTVFNMYVIDGYKHEEIASALGISIGSSKSNLSRARAILQKNILNEMNHG